VHRLFVYFVGSLHYLKQFNICHDHSNKAISRLKTTIWSKQ
jgi:hypothetical protein